MKTVRLEEFNEKSFKEANIDKAIVIFGSTESHGAHLPFGTDTFVPHAIAVDVAEALDNTVVVPPMWYGMSMHYRHKPMCVTLKNDTVTQVVRDVLESLYYWNIQKVLIINGHDGNMPCIEQGARDVKIQHPEMGVAWIGAWWNKITSIIDDDVLEVWNGLGHGGEGETSMVLATVPHLVDMKQAKGMIPDMDPVVDLVWNFQELTNYGASGAPEKGSEKKGKIMREALTNYLIDFVKRMDAQGWRFETRETS